MVANVGEKSFISLALVQTPASSNIHDKPVIFRASRPTHLSMSAVGPSVERTDRAIQATSSMLVAVLLIDGLRLDGIARPQRVLSRLA